jgi:hypothetical protein
MGRRKREMFLAQRLERIAESEGSKERKIPVGSLGELARTIS